MSALALPDLDRDEALDLHNNYFAQRRWFFGMPLALVVVSLVRNVLVMGRLQDQTDFAFHPCFIVGGAGGYIFSNETVHKLLALLSAVVYALYIALLFTAIR